MKTFLKANKSFRIDVIDWEYNYQGFVVFDSIELINGDYYCHYQESHFEVLDNSSESSLDASDFESENWYVICTDRTIRHALRNFLGLTSHLTRTELGSQDVNLARFETTNRPAFSELSSDEETAVTQEQIDSFLRWANKAVELSESSKSKIIG